MKIQSKLILVSAAVLLLTLGINAFVSYREVMANTHAELAKEANNVRALLMATRRVYHLQFTASGLEVNEKTVGFLPAHALSRISKEFPNWTRSGLRFNNVSDRPRNPANQADGPELEAMAWFRANEQAEEHFGEITAVDGQRYFHFTAPLRIETYCLKCHGDRADAPETIRNKYSEAFGYKLGELRGIMSIKIPMAPLLTNAWSVWRMHVLSSFIGFAALFLCLAVLIDRLLVRRLLRLEATAHALAAGNYNVHSDNGGTDEVSSLAVAIQQMADTVQRRDLELNRFAEVTAHHLQEPARRISSYSERLTAQLANRLDDPEARLSLDFIGQQARRMSALVTDVERYLAADQPRGKLEVVETGTLVQRVVDDLSERIASSHASLTLGDLPAAWIDAPRLADLFGILLNNALTHGGAAVHIAIDGERRGSRVRYRVSDNGPGIEEKYRERVFRVFERLDAGGEGTGIGLPIARRIIERCGGRIWIDEAPGGGCCVVFELPANEP